LKRRESYFEEKILINFSQLFLRTKWRLNFLQKKNVLLKSVESYFIEKIQVSVNYSLQGFSQVSLLSNAPIQSNKKLATLL
jgi:hypothetical protein